MPPLRIPWGGGCCCQEGVQQNRETGGSPEEVGNTWWAFNAIQVATKRHDYPHPPMSSPNPAPTLGTGKTSFTQRSDRNDLGPGHKLKKPNQNHTQVWPVQLCAGPRLCPILKVGRLPGEGGMCQCDVSEAQHPQSVSVGGGAVHPAPFHEENRVGGSAGQQAQQVRGDNR